jgi:hypothetical protein
MTETQLFKYHVITCSSATTTYGQPSRSIYDWNLALIPSGGSRHASFADIEHRLKIEKFCDKMTQGLYGDTSELHGIIREDLLPSVLSYLNADLQELNAFSANFSRKLYQILRYSNSKLIITSLQ